ncbi:MAG: hypothetical protein Q7S18_02490 [bacterium]|nr:hypothetical protein [bacterium]
MDQDIQSQLDRAKKLLHELESAYDNDLQKKMYPERQKIFIKVMRLLLFRHNWFICEVFSL